MFLCPILFPLVGFMFTITLSRFISRNAILFINLLSLLLSIISVLYCIYQSITEKVCTIISLGTWLRVGNFLVSWTFLFDNLTLFMIFLVLMISALVHFYSWEYMGSDPHFIRFMAYLSIFTFFMLLFVSSGNFLQMFAGWEGVGLASYLLINFWYTRLQANKSAMKAIIVNRVSDLMLYFSLFTLFFVFGTLDYNSIFSLSEHLQLDLFWLSLIGFCIFIGAVGKSAQLGLHTWLPDAMEGPTPVSALLHAATMVTAGVYLIIRCSPLLNLSSDVTLCIFIIGGLTTFLAGSIGCFQNDIKKIIAYSTCSQLGYMFLTCGLYQYNVAFAHLFNHAFFKALLFLGAGSIIHSLLDEQDIRKMGALFGVLPITYITFIVASLALMGFPYLTGYYSKDLLIELSFFNFSASGLLVYWLALSSAFFTAFYSARLIYYVFYGFPNGTNIKVFESNNVILMVLILLSLLSIITGYIIKDALLGVASDFFGFSLHFSNFSNQLFDTELGFIFGGFYALNKMFPLFVTILSLFIVLVLVRFWSNLIHTKKFRVLLDFISNKWFFDVVYFRFIINPLMYFSYYITFKALDRGLFEFLGSINAAKNLYKVSNLILFYEEGSAYFYVTTSFIYCLFLLSLSGVFSI